MYKTMTDYEWEVGRFPKSPDANWLRVSRARKGPVAEYVAMEFPGESVHWVIKAPAERDSNSSGKAGIPARKPGQRTSGLT